MGSPRQPSLPEEETQSLPLRLSPRTDDAPQTVQPAPTQTVLLVDDNALNLRLLRAYMKKGGFAHISATNGLEALETYKNSTAASDTQPIDQNAVPAIILMDITM